ncbi:CPBP family intramembrane glutamic endopeptidase [Croceitalea vernalis]|uniref:Type II CAAX endopeptidase family protein n=1 Tax=Croceitalea vernalis TaxID=3075599 RepID=A0ABU3BL07_9FLAO|nr:type II CAAX endopeptidase family protein [Croceitalea sp. P007]MDT0622852.1 type II CAAX endopeptidase family protein [Croceitalea sp. P007]
MIKKIKNWDWLRVVALILPYLLVVGVFQVFGYYIAGVPLNTEDYEFNSLQRTIITFTTLLGTVIVLFLFIRFVDKEPFKNLGLYWKGRSKDLLVGILLGAFIMCFAYFLLLGIDSIAFERMVVSWKDILYGILVFTCVSFSEELLFRGYVLKNFMSSFNKYIALVLSSLIFALMHGANPNIDLFPLINLFLAGILLGISYIYTKNIWFPVGLHFSWNIFQTLFGFNVSGIDFYSLIEFKIPKNNLINGGEFGFEGSILAIVFQIILILILFFYFESKNFNTITPS